MILIIGEELLKLIQIWQIFHIKPLNIFIVTEIIGVHYLMKIIINSIENYFDINLTLRRINILTQFIYLP